MKTANSALHPGSSFLLLFLPLILTIAPTYLTAQSCSSCGSADEVEVEFSASGHGGFLYDSSNLSVTLNNVTTNPASPTATSLGTVSLRVDQTYVCTVTGQVESGDRGGSCNAGVIANFQMSENKCGKIMRLSVENPYSAGMYGAWAEASSVVAVGLVDGSGG